MIHKYHIDSIILIGKGIIRTEFFQPSIKMSLPKFEFGTFAIIIIKIIGNLSQRFWVRILAWAFLRSVEKIHLIWYYLLKYHKSKWHIKKKDTVELLYVYLLLPLRFQALIGKPYCIHRIFLTIIENEPFFHTVTDNTQISW